ncbi:unnamed protein product [Dovyalis caffra]|uniref:Uncharacterized protein n=1 Tax=Dovyalis caffra TaxID=77055 RepID=A0AAV1R483_9ROSI|nr:unnamed protein product [Dovyalis caffra]
MKREGRPHGMVRTYRILSSPWNPKALDNKFNKFDTLPTAGLFAKVPSKPTNHSKFTGKCSKQRCTGCHMHPTCKSKDKTKGSHKVKSHDRDMNWGAEYGAAWFSATEMLDHLTTDAEVSS